MFQILLNFDLILGGRGKRGGVTAELGAFNPKYRILTTAQVQCPSFYACRNLNSIF